MYQYSLDAFNTFLQKAIDRTQVTVETCVEIDFQKVLQVLPIVSRLGSFFEDSEDVKERTERLIASIRITIFRWARAKEIKEKHRQQMTTRFFLKQCFVRLKMCV